jgi:hypothetical protein
MAYQSPLSDIYNRAGIYIFYIVDLHIIIIFYIDHNNSLQERSHI